VPTLGVDGNLEAAHRFAAENGFPLVCKPRRGFASRDVRLILDERQLERACAQPDQVLQKYCGDANAVRRLAEDLALNGIPLFNTLEGTKLSIQASITRDGAVAKVFASGNVMRLGRSESVHVVDDVQAIAAGTRWASAFAQAGWRGPLNIQGHRADDGEITIFEYNGRFTGATAARQQLGFDEVGLVLQDWLGFAPTAVECERGREVTCYLGGRALDRAKVARLQSDFYWAAP
jgi:carbamoyl-phosphate synthase large subunit